MRLFNRRALQKYIPNSFEWPSTVYFVDREHSVETGHISVIAADLGRSQFPNNFHRDESSEYKPRDFNGRRRRNLYANENALTGIE